MRKVTTILATYARLEGGGEMLQRVKERLKSCRRTQFILVACCATIIGASCAALINAQPPAGTSLLRRVNERLTSCGRPQVASLSHIYAVGKGFEVRAGTKTYFAEVGGDIKPDPCGNAELAVTIETVRAINEEGLGWTAELTDDAVGKTAKDYGFAENPKGTANEQPAAPSPPTIRRALEGNNGIPEAYDASDRYQGEQKCIAFVPRSQGGCGSCTHFAVTSSLAARLCLQNGRTPESNVRLSPQHMVECTNGCDGSNSGANLEWFRVNGMKDDWCKPYRGVTTNNCSSMCTEGRTYSTSDTQSVAGVMAMQVELMLNGPGAIAVQPTNDIFAYSKGVYRPSVNATALTSGHAMMLVGWGTDNGTPYWIVQNSWGSGWGEKGFVRWLRGSDLQGIESRGLTVASPKLPPRCPGEPCGNGSATLADCSCRCDNAWFTGPKCTTPVGPCENGGVLTLTQDACVCPQGIYGIRCQDRFALSPLATATAAVITVSIPGNLDPLIPAYLDMYNENTKLVVVTGATPVCCPMELTKTIPRPTQPGQYKVSLWTRVETKLVGYFTVLPSTATVQELEAAAAQNDPANMITTFMATELALFAPMKARLDAAKVAVLAIKAAPPANLTVPILSIGPTPTFWLSAPPTTVCYSIPPTEKTQTMALQLVSLTNYAFSAYVLPADRSTCITHSIPYKSTMSSSERYKLIIADPFNNNKPLASTQPFEIAAITWMLGGTALTTTTAKITMAALIRRALSSTPRDVIRLVDRSGAFAAEFTCFPTGVTTSTTIVATLIPTRNLAIPTRGPYTIRYYSGDYVEPVAVFTPTAAQTAKWVTQGL